VHNREEVGVGAWRSRGAALQKVGALGNTSKRLVVVAAWMDGRADGWLGGQVFKCV